MKVEVGQLVDVPLRDVWFDEAAVFTPWLAANPEHLSEALGMNLELVDTEVAVGPFSADIVLVDIESDRRVVVENFLEATDHDHLGKLITYASGLEASYAVLVAKRFRPEHRSALAWLNDVSTTDAGFFGLEIHAVRIGDSMPAIRLDVVVEPDDWQRQVRETAAASLSESQRRYLDWWSEFLPALHEAHPGWSSASKPQHVNWINLPAGRSGLRYGINFSWPDGASNYSLRVELYIDDGERHFDHFLSHRAEIEAAFGPGLVFDRVESSKASRIFVALDPVDPDDRAAWPEYRRWGLEQLGGIRTALRPFIETAP